MTLKVVTLGYYLKKEYLDLDNFCFEITHTHLRQCGETSADLAANFKLTNHTAADFQTCFKLTNHMAADLQQ